MFEFKSQQLRVLISLMPSTCVFEIPNTSADAIFSTYVSLIPRTCVFKIPNTSADTMFSTYVCLIPSHFL